MFVRVFHDIHNPDELFSYLGPGTTHAWNADDPQSRWHEAAISWTILEEDFQCRLP
jgi:hypothetical protein